MGLFVAIIAIGVAGCCRPVTPPPPVIAYNGPTDTMEQVVDVINRNARKVPSLVTDLSYSAELIDANKKKTQVSGDGSLLFMRPRNLVLRGSKDAAGAVFEIGSNDDEFWFKSRIEFDAWVYYWGHYANLGKPCCKPLPIQPNLVLEVLGVGVTQSNFLDEPVPVMRFDNGLDCYVFDFNVRHINRWVTTKEVWYDRATKLPKQVVLFDVDGRAVLRAALSDHGPAEVPESPQDQQPMIARKYDLFFPDTGSRMTFELAGPSVYRTRGERHIPAAVNFKRPFPDENNKVEQLDVSCPDAK